MKVIAKKSTTRLVKGSEYEVLRLENDPLNRWKRIRIKLGKSTYFSMPDNFTMLDGSPVIKKNWINEEVRNRIETIIDDVRKLKKGDILICVDPTKSFDEGSMYKVKDILYKERQIGKSTSFYKEQKVKIEGFNRWIDPSRFRNLSYQEKREMSLSGIFGEKVEVSSDFLSIRKIDRYDDVEKKTIIASCLLSSIIDDTRNNMSIIDWTLARKGKKYDINIEDIKPLLDMKLSDIIKELDDI